jgi:hypothetical protein
VSFAELVPLFWSYLGLKGSLGQVKVGSCGDQVERLAKLLGCGISTLPVKYLSFAIGGFLESQTYRGGVIEKIVSVVELENDVFIKGWQGYPY